MIESKGKLAMGKLRRVALDRQGLLKGAHFGRGKNATLKAIEHLGYVQIDTISVVERAHHHVLHTRVPNYQPAHLDKLVAEGKVFEYWSHAAAYLPMRDYRYALPTMRLIKRNRETGAKQLVRSRDEKLMREILERIRSDGALKSRDFEDDRETKAGWWDWKPAKRALEQLFFEGELMITGRDGFQKAYDLPERVLPSDVTLSEPTEAEYAEHLVDNTLRAHGFATLKSFNHGRRGFPTLRTAIKACLDAAVDEGRVNEFKTADGGPWYGDAAALAERAPSSGAAVKILSPFDNAVILRHRGQALFDFDYQIECYVKEEERRFGYFCLPILYRDQFVGRADCKAHRGDGRLEIKGLFVERPVDDDFLPAFADAAWTFAACNGCTEVTLTGCDPKALATPITKTLAEAAP